MFYPDLPVTVSVGDTRLDRYRNWCHVGTRELKYEDTQVEAIATYHAGPAGCGVVMERDVTNIVDFRSADPVSMQVEGLNVTGICAGTTKVQAVKSDNVLGEEVVEISNDDMVWIYMEHLIFLLPCT